MSQFVKKARKGNKNAMVALYLESYHDIGYMCEAFLLDHNEAEDAFAHAYKSAYDAVFAGKIENDEKFYDYLERKTASYCKNKLKKKAPRELSPSKRSLEICAISDIRASSLAQLPAIYRLVLVLGKVKGWSDEKIAKLLEQTKTEKKEENEDN